jgi:glutamate N-acetyltransferase/amino-acid N-acetyltransferase
MADGPTLDLKAAELADVPGFRTGVATCGLKAEGPDVAVLVCEESDGTGSAVFTRNLVAAAPVILSRPRAEARLLRAAVVNAGNANCCTGRQGLRDAAEMSSLASSALGVPEDAVLVASTGVIGRPLPMEKVRAGIEAACRDAKGSGRGDLARAILTTDTVRKTASASGSLGGRAFRVAGAAKGSGMIAPDMATMLAFLVTDAAVSPDCLRALLPAVAARTFNRVTVDGDTSTNDAFCLLASGRAGNAPLEDPESAEGKTFTRAVEAVARELARAMARDGEGATRLVEVRVSGAASERDARLACRAIAGSLLVKTAVHGADPNWGRVLAAAGRSGAKVDAARATVRLSGVAVYEKGEPVEPLPEGLERKMAGPEATIELDLGLGDGIFGMWTCDLSARYVEINAQYRT